MFYVDYIITSSNNNNNNNNNDNFNQSRVALAFAQYVDTYKHFRSNSNFALPRSTLKEQGRELHELLP